MSKTSSLLYEQDGDRQSASHAGATYPETIDPEASDAEAAYAPDALPEPLMAIIHRDAKLLPSKADGSSA
jgi:hypothetical protein